MTGYLEEAELVKLVGAAYALVYPSFFEGFGVPVLEAMKCGAPVIVGNKTSLPEVVGDAALKVDPFDVTSIAAAIERLINDSVLRRELSVKGRMRAEMFDWLETARQTLEIYQQVGTRV